MFTAACPPEALHSLENGLINHCLKELFEHFIAPATQSRFDQVVQAWSTYPKQQHMKAYAADYPRLLFPTSVSSISDISAGTKVGILFAIVVAALTRYGRDVLLHDANVDDNNYVDMIEAFELLLCYWAWLKKDEYWDCDDMDALQCAKTSICKTVNQLKRLFPRSSGSEWKIPKVHEQLHVAYNIHLWGSHQNIHTGPQEHNHIENSKRPSERTQKRQEKFDWQLANRLFEKYVVNHLQNRIKYQESLTKGDNIDSMHMAKASATNATHMASKFEVVIKLDAVTNRISCESGWTSKAQKDNTVYQALLQLVVDHCFMNQSLDTQIAGVHVHGFTEYTRDNMTFRAHPDYKKEGAWNDHALVAWTVATTETNACRLCAEHDDNTPDHVEVPSNDGGTSMAMLIPAKIMCFVEDQHNDRYAIIHSCLQHHKRMSVLTYRWQLEYMQDYKHTAMNAQYLPQDNTIGMTPVYHKVSVDTLHKHCLMLPYDQISNFLMEITDEEYWAAAFSAV